MTPLAGMVFDIRKYSVHDGPGIRTTVFLKGCPLRCSWCHNPEGQARQPEILYRSARCIQCDTCLVLCPQGAVSRQDSLTSIQPQKCDLCGLCIKECYAEALQIAGRSMSIQEVMSEIGQDLIFYEQSKGGVTISGGEPLLQPDFLLGLLQACKSIGIHTAVDTSGYASWEVLDRVRPFTDLFLYDLKLMDSERHRQHTGVPNEPILRNLKKLADKGHPLIVRIPIIPGINDDVENLAQTEEFLAGIATLQRVDLLPYHRIGEGKYLSLQREYSLAHIKPPQTEQMQFAAGIFSGGRLPVKIGA